jgi:hypothetical protein
MCDPVSSCEVDGVCCAPVEVLQAGRMYSGGLLVCCRLVVVRLVAMDTWTVVPC